MTPEQINSEFEDIGAKYLKDRTEKTFGTRRFIGPSPKRFIK